MGAAPKEPARRTDINELEPWVKDSVLLILKDLKKRGFDPIVYEAFRTEERQDWLYGVGRTHSMQRKPVTWTHNSRHMVGKAVDIISRKNKWNDPKFFTALKTIARKYKMITLAKEQCHLEYTGK